MKNIKFFGLIVLALAITGCSDDLKEQIGLGKRAPDEFKVVARAPLSLPPDYNLAPPRPGALRPQEGSAQGQAKRAVFNLDGTAGPEKSSSLDQAGRSDGEMALLQSAGANEAPDDIRLLIDRETRQLNSESEQVVDALIFWKDQPNPNSLVDPVKEAKRIQENAALGTRGKGETEVIVIEREAPLEGVFDNLF
ncbi:hypothetical protein WH95_05050 [Kiloniella litopenaei]|uniref:Beta-barrel assembly machine subunit BamF n=1 Tax=Kiloniella litopenaei TaxID=1549748 RepID=A0A0M2RDH6_9PROT|nr:DUF3035 domain-containing protein [Kiloniella litopenaei]KKJ78060.1 hypothetical protein WH95_05050 [Kiloniella litopenaei]